MPHTCQPPSTAAQILATADPDPSWTDILEEYPIPTGADWGDDCSTLKRLSEGVLPRLQSSLNESRPTDIIERDVQIDIPTTSMKPEGGQIRVLVSHRQGGSDSGTSNTSKLSPVIVLFHGGGHTVGNPESEIPLARLLVQEFHAIVVMPAYRLAPEHVFPSSFSDSLETIKTVARDIQNVLSSPDTPTPTGTHILPNDIDLTNDFIIGGTSAGATIAASINHLYHRWQNSNETSNLPNSPRLPAVTGLFLSCGTYINPHAIPSAYEPFYLSHAQNRDAAPVDQDMYDLFHNAAKVDPTDPVWSSFDQQGPSKPLRNRVGEDHAWMAGIKPTTDYNGNKNIPDKDSDSGRSRRIDSARVYFQVCGQDLSRDDSLIYERVLREECGVETRMDLYEGFGHVFWGIGGKYPEMEMSVKRLDHSVEAVRWLLK